MATETYFAITNGASTATFADGAAGATNYKIAHDTWAPAVAGLRHSELSGRGPYDDVVEEMQVVIGGSTATHCLSNLANLNKLLDQAERWYRGESASPVLVQYSPKGATVSSASAPLRAAILGRVPGDASALRLPSNFDGPILGDNGYIFNARLRFMRRGWWLGASAASTSATGTNGDLLTVDLTAIDHPSPYDLTLQAQFGGHHSTAYLAVSDEQGRIVIIDAEGMTATGWTAASGSAQLARGGSVLRYTPTGTSESLSGSFAASALNVDARLLAFYANIRNNSASAAYSVRVQVAQNTLYTYTPPLTIPTSASNPRWYPLGIVATSIRPTALKLAATASASGGTLDIDSLVVVDLSTGRSYVIELPNDPNVPASGSSATVNLTVRHRLLTHPEPIVSWTGTEQGWAYGGDIVLASKEFRTHVLLMATGGSASADRWRLVDPANAASPLTFTHTVTRTRAYLVPA